MLFIPFFVFGLVLHDYMKSPIDRLYFQNMKRPMFGILNSLIDIFFHSQIYRIHDFTGLWLIKFHYKKIKKEFDEISKTLNKNYFHDSDHWFDKNDNYYFYRVKDFPVTNSLVQQIPSIYKNTAVFAVIEGPMYIAPHRAETNFLLRYHLTIQSEDTCTLYTYNKSHVHEDGQAFLFDHARYHEVNKPGNGKRVVLILDVRRI